MTHMFVSASATTWFGSTAATVVFAITLSILPFSRNMVSQSSRTTPNELLEPQPSQQPRKKSKKAANWVAQARSRATGTLRRTLFGQKSKSARARDAESIIPEQDDDYTQTNYDTVKSLPATGHYGRSRVGHHLHVDVEGHLGLPPQPYQPPPVIILKVPRRRQSAQPCRISPIARVAVYDPVFDFQAWHSALDESKYFWNLPPFQASLFNSFDSMTIGSAVNELNTVFFGRVRAKTRKMVLLFSFSVQQITW